MRKIRPRLTFANVCSFLALIIALGTGSAYAANTVFSSDIVDGQVKTPDLASNVVRTGKVANQNLTGADIANQSGVDNCTHGALRFGELCIRVLQTANTWNAARNLCSDAGLRLPSLSEAESAASNHNLPSLGETDAFWTEELYFDASFKAFAVDDSGAAVATPIGSSRETVCATTPTN
jgi:hypothetical protein